MHTYLKSKDGPTWTVGHYMMDSDEHYGSWHVWVPMRDFAKEEDAAAYVNYLNGGKGSLQ